MESMGKAEADTLAMVRSKGVVSGRELLHALTAHEEEDLIKAVQALSKKALIRFKGPASLASDFRRAYITVPPSARKYVDQTLKSGGF